MTRPACTHENPDRAKFCLECGAALRAQCSSCATALPPTAKFCLECGAAVGVGSQASEVGRGTETRHSSPATSSDTRKTVSILFADLAGSTALQERLDPESVRAFMGRYYEAMRAAVERHGGHVIKLLGDGVMAAFGVPRVAEDDAMRAVRAAVAMQKSLRSVAGERGDIGLRVAVNTGEVVVSGDDSDVLGDPVNVAARLQQEAGLGDVVIGEATQRLVATQVSLEPLGRFALKGRAAAVNAYRIVSLERPTRAAAVPFVGREEEVRRIMAVYESAVAAPAARLAVLLGSPGLGKSRLIDEIVRRLGDDATVLSAHCDAAGGATFEPLAAALRKYLKSDLSDGSDLSDIEALLPGGDAEPRAGGLSKADRSRIAGGIRALLSGSPASPEESFFVVRRFLTGLAAAKPVILVIDDLHWAEPLLLDLVEHLVHWGKGAPLLVLASARPELRDVRSSFASSGGAVADVVTLSGLDAGAAMRLAAHVVGAADLPAAVAGKVLATSEGNPLFVSELVRMLVQEGALAREGDRWTVGAGLASLEMPPTIHALLAARIERLRAEDRTVLERAAVVGRHFSRGAVAQLLPHDLGDLDMRIESLKRSELIEPDTGWFLGEPLLRFHHALICDAAYRRLLKGTRAALHARLAEWIESNATDTGEHDETIGWHLEHAHRLLGELGPLDPRGKDLGERAARRLAAAGRRALARDDVPGAADLLGRAIDRVDQNDPARAELALDWCEALLAAADVGRAAEAIEVLARFAGITTSDAPRATRHERLRAWHTCFTGQLTVMTAPQELESTATAVAAAAAEFAAFDDAAGEAKAHFVQAQALARLGRVGACEAALDKALAAARKAGDRRRANAVLAGAPLAALWGPSPVPRASGRCLDVVRVLRITQGAPAVEAVALSCQGVLEALRGRTAAARRLIASSRTKLEELGIAHRLFEADVFAARIDLLEGDADAAVHHLRGAYEGLRKLGLGIDAARAGALLARALLARGEAGEAEALTHESEQLAGDDLQAAIAWRGVRAEALARRGAHAAAVELAGAAVAIAAATDALLDHADACLALAAAQRAAGRRDEADVAERSAIELWETKGATVLAERARRQGQVAVAERDLTAEECTLVPAFANPAWRAFQAAFADAWVARDLHRFAALHAPSLRSRDHRRLFRLDLDRAQFLEYARPMLAAAIRHASTLLATRGERLALVRFSVEFGEETGPSAIDSLAVVEVDGTGLVTSYDRYDPDDLDAADAELERRWQVGEAQIHPIASKWTGDWLHSFTARDWDGMRSLLAPDLVSDNHRFTGWGALRGSSAQVSTVQATVELAPDIQVHVEHLRTSERGLLMQCTYRGTREGGFFETPWIAVAELGGRGRVRRLDAWDIERMDEALARFAALADEQEVPSSHHSFANAASRIPVQIARAWATGDWETFTAAHDALHAPTHRYDDRRPLMRLTTSVETSLESLRVLFDVPGSRWNTALLATRGERLALTRMTFEGSVDGGGDLAIDYLALGELDEQGPFEQESVIFDPDDVDAAYAELDRRYAAGEGRDDETWSPAMALPAAIHRRDLEACRTMFGPGFRVADHRKLGWGGTLRDAETFLQAQFALNELSSDWRYRIDHYRARGRASMGQQAQVGTREGGVFENPFLIVGVYDEQGLLLGLDVYDVDQLERAWARFEELSAAHDPRPTERRFANGASRRPEDFGPYFAAVAWTGSPPRTPEHERESGNRLFIPPNAASAALDRLLALLDAGTLEAVQAFCATMEFDDRRRMFRTTGDGAQFVENSRFIWESGLRPNYTRLATNGDRLLLHRALWRSITDGDASEVETLEVFEVDGEGRLVAVVIFDPEDRAAASEEVFERFAASGADGVRPEVLEFARAWNAHDLERMRELLPGDFSLHDRRRTGVGRLDGAEAYLESLAAMYEISRDLRTEMLYLVSAAEHGSMFVARWSGTNAEGGEFEAVYYVIGLLREGRPAGMEIFELDDLDCAVARYEELRSLSA